MSWFRCRPDMGSQNLSFWVRGLLDVAWSRSAAPARVLACVVLLAVSVGCRLSVSEAGGRNSSRFVPGRAQPEIPRLQPVPERVGNRVPPVPENAPGSESMSGPITPVPTPLLDAALKHAEAVEQAHREAIAAREMPLNRSCGQPDGPSKVLAAGMSKSAQDDKEPVRSFKLSSSGQTQVSTPRTRGEAQVRPPRTTAPHADPARRSGSGDVPTEPPVRAQLIEWLASEAAKPANQAMFQRAVNTIADAVKNSVKDDPTRSADVRSAVLALEDRVPLGVSELRLCRKVSGFGSFEPLPASAHGRDSRFSFIASSPDCGTRPRTRVTSPGCRRGSS